LFDYVMLVENKKPTYRKPVAGHAADRLELILLPHGTSFRILGHTTTHGHNPGVACGLIATVEVAVHPSSSFAA
jgi:hypothetical protein